MHSILNENCHPLIVLFLFTSDHNLVKFVRKHAENVENVNGECKFHENTEYHQTALSREQDFQPSQTRKDLFAIDHDNF